MHPGHHEPGLRARVGDANSEGGQMQIIVLELAGVWRRQPLDRSRGQSDLGIRLGYVEVTKSSRYGLRCYVSQ